MRSIADQIHAHANRDTADQRWPVQFVSHHEITRSASSPDDVHLPAYAVTLTEIKPLDGTFDIKNRREGDRDTPARWCTLVLQLA